jgi:hypothetical protein
VRVVDPNNGSGLSTLQLVLLLLLVLAIVALSLTVGFVLPRTAPPPKVVGPGAGRCPACVVGLPCQVGLSDDATLLVQASLVPH